MSMPKAKGSLLIVKRYHETTPSAIIGAKSDFLDHEGHLVKPVSFNQLLFHPKGVTLSFFIAPHGPQHSEMQLTFLQDMVKQLELQHQMDLAQRLSDQETQILKIIRSHPRQSHGFFFSLQLQGYMIIDNEVDTYCMIGNTFHVRPLFEELFINPEFMVVNVSLHDIKVFRGDFQGLEIYQHYEYDQVVILPEMRSRVYTPQNAGILPYKTLMAVKVIAGKIRDSVNYQALPVFITGLGTMKDVFIRHFEPSAVTISEIQEDFFEKTCMEVLEGCRPYRNQVMDFYSQQLIMKIKKMIKSKRLISDLPQIVAHVANGDIVQLVLPTKIRLPGKIDLIKGVFEIHEKESISEQSVDILNELAEEVMRQGGRIQILGNHFFPAGSHVLAVIRG